MMIEDDVLVAKEIFPEESLGFGWAECKSPWERYFEVNILTQRRSGWEINAKQIAPKLPG